MKFSFLVVLDIPARWITTMFCSGAISEEPGEFLRREIWQYLGERPSSWNQPGARTEVGFIQPLLCAGCGSEWSQKIFNTDACEECRCRFEWVLAEPAPGQKFDRASFGRYLESGGPKSARGWLSRIRDFAERHPLQVVVYAFLAGYWGWTVANLLHYMKP